MNRAVKRLAGNIYFISIIGSLLSVFVFSLMAGIFYLLLPKVSIDFIDDFAIELNVGLSNNVVGSVADTKIYQDDQLREQIVDYLGKDRVSHYAIYLYDLKSKEVVFEHRSRKFLPPASISKLPSVILTLRDVDAGKYTLEDTIPVVNNQKHTTYDAIGQYPQGTQLPLSLYVEEAIRTSNNTAHYHLHENLGGSEVVNPRTQEELNADQFFLYPFFARAEAIANVLIGVYEGSILSPESREHLLDLMINAAPSLKTAIPAGLPSDINVANKVGFLFGGEYGNTFADAGIVFGENTDYVLVILNDKTTPFPTGAEPIKHMSAIIYNYMENRSYTVN